MREIVRLAVVPLALLIAVPVPYADEYPVCKERCATDNAECLKSIRKAPADAKPILEKACQVEVAACSSDCEEIRSIAGIIRKVME